MNKIVLKNKQDGKLLSDKFAYAAICRKNKESKYKADRVFVSDKLSKELDLSDVKLNDIIEVASFNKEYNPKSKYEKFYLLVIEISEEKIICDLIDSLDKAEKKRKIYVRAIDQNTKIGNWKTKNIVNFLNKNNLQNSELEYSNFFYESKQNHHCQMCGTQIKYSHELKSNQKENFLVLVGGDCAINQAGATPSAYLYDLANKINENEKLMKEQAKEQQKQERKAA